jgi:hypothetical protein
MPLASDIYHMSSEARKGVEANQEAQVTETDETFWLSVDQPLVPTFSGGAAGVAHEHRDIMTIRGSRGG